MSNISAVTSQSATSASSLVKTYSPLDTNEDGVVSPAELAAAMAPAETDTGSTDLPTSSAADTVSQQTASAIIDVQAADADNKPGLSIQDALSAYLSTENT